MDKKNVFSNLLVAFIAQGISMFLSFIISFILPKILSIEYFSYWQLFIFYTSYVGFFHFGINDGVYVRYGGKYLSEMNKQYVSGQFKLLVLIQIVLIFICILPVIFIDLDLNRKCVLMLTLIYMLVFNISNYLGYIFQAANKTKIYSYSVMIDKVFFLVAILTLFLLRVDHYIVFIICYLIGKILCLLYCVLKAKNIIFNKILNYKDVIGEMLRSMKVGIKITFSSMASMLVLGIGRFMIDNNWGINVFGKVSFSLSLTTFALAFIAQISMVFFPMIKRINDNSQKIVYEAMRLFCFVVLPLLYIIIIPAKSVLNIWIPQYSDSILYLSILLPICVFDAKMNMIFNTFFKALRREKILLIINVITFCLSLLLCIVGVYLLESYIFILISMVLCIMVRSTVSEILLGKILHSIDFNKMVYEFFLALIYIFVSLKLDFISSFCIILILYIFELIIFRNEIIFTFKKIIKLR